MTTAESSPAQHKVLVRSSRFLYSDLALFSRDTLEYLEAGGIQFIAVARRPDKTGRPGGKFVPFCGALHRLGAMLALPLLCSFVFDRADGRVRATEAGVQQAVGQAAQPDESAVKIEVGHRSADRDAVVAVPVHFAAPAGENVSELELEISFPSGALELLEVEKGRRTVAVTRIAGTADEAPGQVRLRIQPPPGADTGGSIPPGLAAFLVFRIRPLAPAGNTGITGSGRARVGGQETLVRVVAGRISVLAPGVGELEADSGAPGNINPYIASSCFFYMH